MIRKVNMKQNIIQFSFLILALIFAIPSVIYLVKNQSIYNFIEFWTCFFRIPTSSIEKLANAFFFFFIFSAMFLCYYFLLKNANDYFKSKKKLAIMIITISAIFMIIIPYTSSDVYSYIAHGWSSAHYDANPYYQSINDVVEQEQVYDKMFGKVANCWRTETVVYGPLWTLICEGITTLSMGNIDVSLLLFKLISLFVHLLICYLIWKITKKKVFVILYGLNPFVLFETLSNVHNDSFVLLFIILAIFVLIRRRNLPLAIICIAMATGIKYFAVLIAPFIVLYYIRSLPLMKKIQYSILSCIGFLSVLVLLYVPYIRDFQVLAGLFIQQNKYNKSIYHLIFQYLGENSLWLFIVKNGTLLIFISFYIVCIFKYFRRPMNTFSTYMRTYQKVMLVFTFILITNFNPWYILWLFPAVFWQGSKTIALIISASYASQMAHLPYFALYSEEQVLGIPYLIILVLIITLLYIIENESKKEVKNK